MDSIHFPDGKSGNILRGAFGTLFRRAACVGECPGPRSCELRAACPYARMFEPAALTPGPSGLGDWPRPFVFRAAHLDGSTPAPGSEFFFDLNLFETKNPAMAYFARAFGELAHAGLGPRRGRAELTGIWQRNAAGAPQVRLYDGRSWIETAPRPLELSLEPPAEEVRHVRVRFLTPTELKSGQQPVDRPEFGVLAARIRDRLSTLRQLYGDGPLEIDFRGFGERAARVRMVRCELRRVEVERRSSRTGQAHSIGGFSGEAEYEGDLTEFLPYLRAACWTGAGRQTVWGKGALEVG